MVEFFFGSVSLFFFVLGWRGSCVGFGMGVGA